MAKKEIGAAQLELFLNAYIGFAATKRCHDVATTFGAGSLTIKSTGYSVMKVRAISGLLQISQASYSLGGKSRSALNKSFCSIHYLVANWEQTSL